MKRLIFCLMVLGMISQNYGQEINDGMLDEVVVRATNYKYLNTVGTREATTTVNELQKKVAQFDLKESEFYQDDYDTYKVYFYIPNGKILAAYDKDGNLLRTVEKFTDIALPQDVLTAVAKKYPGWSIYKDVYLINYSSDKQAKKTYKVRLENGVRKVHVKTDENGVFL